MNTVTPHELAADDVITVMMHESAAIDRATFELGLRPVYWPSNQHRAVYDALLSLRKANEPIHDTTVLAKCNGAVDLTWYTQRYCLYDVTRTGATFDSNVKLIVDYGTRAGIRQLLSIADKQLADGKTAQSVIYNLIETLSTIHADKGIKHETAKDHGLDFRAFMDAEPIPRRSTGLDWLDELSGGFDPGHIWWIAGAYKGRKSTLMLNLVLNQLMEGGSVCILSREMQRRRVNAQLVSMLAVGYLLQNNLYNAKDKWSNPLNWISATGLIQAQKNYRRWDDRKVAAVDYGIAQYTRFANRLRIYDTGDGSGSLSDLASAYNVIKRDKALYGVDLVCADYLQLFDAPGKSFFDKTSRLAQTFQQVAQRENVTVMVVAQKNEESIKGEESYSPGIKGGGDPAQTADYLLVTGYKQTDSADENHVDVNMRLSRHGRGGRGEKHSFNIHPASGLLLESTWLKPKERQVQL